MKHHRIRFRRTLSVLGLAALGACAGGPRTTQPVAAGGRRDGEWVRLAGEGRGSLGHWKVVDEADFSAHGAVRAENGILTLEAGSPATGIAWTDTFPRIGYEIALDAMRVEGNDFFCGLTFPVGESPCTLIVGGWGGMVVGLSNVDDMHAADNETTQGIWFDNKHWYPIRLRVTTSRIQVWIDGDPIINLPTANRRFSIWPEQQPVKPLGIATWYTKAKLRNIRFRCLPTGSAVKTSAENQGECKSVRR